MPTFPVPTPIIGVQAPGGKPSMRLPIDQFQSQQPFAFALYVQALLAWQQAGSPTVDPDNVNGTSYFQVAGVHGYPFVSWQEDPTPGADPEDPHDGYCTHRSVLFIPWHRPYLILIEQMIYAYAQEIAENATGYAGEAYQQALLNLRLPYWDWSLNSDLPDVITTKSITLTVPGSGPGQTSQLTLDQNPLYSYQFTSPWATSLNQTQMSWPSSWPETKRCPLPDGTSQQDIATKQMRSISSGLRESTYNILTTIQDFDEATCTAWKPNLSVSQFGSIEEMHDNVHDFVGTEQKKSSVSGNMSSIEGSAFDPIFWLHHVHIDRLAALWQGKNPNCVINPFALGYDRFTKNAGPTALEDGTSNLEPWHKTSAHTMQDYFTGDDEKELSSTFFNGYYYPETPLDLFGKQEEMKAWVTIQINKLYKDSVLKLHLPSAPPEDALLPKEPVSTKTWQVFLRVNAFALPGTWGIYVFLGEPPASSTDWLLAPNNVGIKTVLTRSASNCSNCRDQGANNQLVTGSVILDSALVAREFRLTNVDAIVEYLKKNLTWRVVKNSQNVDITPALTLSVGVASRDVTYPTSDHHDPVYGDDVIYPEATAGKTGGVSGDFRNVLQLQD